MTTGFSTERARPHETALDDLFAFFATRGYLPERLDVDGDRPDLRITDRDSRLAYVDLKVTAQENLAMKIGALHTFVRIENSGNRVYVIWATPSGFFVDTPWSIMGRISGGPRRATGNGSNTDWYLVRPGGSRLVDYFMEIAA